VTGTSGHRGGPESHEWGQRPLHFAKLTVLRSAVATGDDRLMSVSARSASANEGRQPLHSGCRLPRRLRPL